MEDKRLIIYTIGHSNTEVEDFVKLLKTNNIEILVDVRSVPYSKYTCQFNKDELEKDLLKIGIKYLYLGNLLGGKPKDEDCYTGGKPDYERVRKKEFYLEGIGRLLNDVGKCRIAIMCSEEDPMECHRRNLIGLDMHERGIRIVHIRHSGVLQKDDFSDLKSFPVQGSLFG